MTRLLKYIIPIFLYSSCSEQKGNHFFDFDRVEYYSLNIDAYELINTLDTPRKLSKIQKKEANLVFDNYPKSIKDTLFISKLEKYDFTKTNIDQKLNSEIKEIFRERFKIKNEFKKCATVYRDIFIFKKDKKIIGVSKICFECNRSYFLGTESNTYHFGNSGEFMELKKLIGKVKL